MEYFKGTDAGEKARKWIDGDEKAIISTINIAEVYRWILQSYDEAIAEEKRRIMKRRCSIIPVSESIAVEAAKIRKKKGLGLGDAIIYSTAKSENSRILTGDRDFKAIDIAILIE